MSIYDPLLAKLLVVNDDMVKHGVIIMFLFYYPHLDLSLDWVYYDVAI